MNASRVRWMAILMFVGAAVGLFVLDSTGNMGGFFDFLRDPVSAVAGWTSLPAQNLSETLAGPGDMAAARERIALLEAQVAALERLNEEQRERLGEYQLLDDLSDYAAEREGTEWVVARVIGWDSSPLFESIIIDKGRDDGVQIGMPVDSQRGLVGQVFRTTADAAMVLLITDSSSSVPARLSGSRSVGVLHGGGLGGEMRMDWIPLEAEVTEGDVVITSGLVGEFVAGLQVSRFPRGLVIGRVTQVTRSEAEILQRATVQSAVDFEGLEVVFVVTDFPRNDLTGFEDPLGENVEEP